MPLAIATAVVAVCLGALAALVAHRWLWVLAPVRAFAVVAVAASVALHLLPETIGAAGWPVLLACALGFLAPPLIGRIVEVAAAGARHRRLAIELGYLGVLLHQVGDGLGLGAMTREQVDWAFVIGIVAHSVPIVAMMTLTFVELAGLRQTTWRVLGLLAATLAGIALTGSDHVLTREAGSWINAAVAGLLFHILLHDADDREVPAAARPLEVAGVVIGVVLPLLADHDHHGNGLAAALPDALVSAASAVGVVTLVLLLLARAFLPSGPRGAVLDRLAGPGVPLLVVLTAYALAALRAADGVVWSPREFGVPTVLALGAAAAVGALILTTIARVGFLAWLGSGHRHAELPAAHAHDHHHPHAH